MNDYDLQEALVKSKLQRYQQQAQTQAPQGQMIGKTFVAPNVLEYLAAGLRGYGGMKGVEQTEADMTNLAQRKQAAMADVLRKFGQSAQGTPAQPGMPEVTGNNPSAFVPEQAPQAAKAPDMMGGYQQLMASGFPELQKMGMQGALEMPKLQAQEKEHAANRDWRTTEAVAAREARAAEAQATRDARAQELQAKLADARTSQAERLAAQKEMREMQIQAQKEMKSMVGAISKAQPYFQPVQTAQGVMSFNARTGQMEPIKVGGAAVVGSNSDPKLQGDITGAKEGAKAGVEKGVELGKSNKRSDQLLSALDKAEALLKLGPTNSGVGAGVDFAGRMVGATSNSAKLASELETISGWMTSNVPRMEGPQSNFDVQNYQVMAAKVGDRTVPVPERLAAAKGLRELQTKYKAINNETIEAPKPGAKSVVRTGTLNGRKVNQYSDGTTDYAD